MIGTWTKFPSAMQPPPLENQDVDITTTLLCNWFWFFINWKKWLFHWKLYWRADLIITTVTILWDILESILKIWVLFYKGIEHYRACGKSWAKTIVSEILSLFQHGWIVIYACNVFITKQSSHTTKFHIPLEVSHIFPPTPWMSNSCMLIYWIFKLTHKTINR